MSCSVCPRRRGSRAEHPGRQAGRQRARSPRLARGVRTGARASRPRGRGARRWAGRQRAVAAARAAGREAGRPAGHDPGSGGSGRAGDGRSREPPGGDGAARRRPRCGRVVGRGRWIARRSARPRRLGTRRGDRRSARRVARELPARRADPGDRPHGSGRLGCGRAPPQRERGRRGRGDRRRARSGRVAARVGRPGGGGGWGAAARARGRRRRDAHRARRSGRRDGGQAARRDGGAPGRSPRRPHRRSASPGRRPSGHADPRRRGPAGVTAMPSGASALPTAPALLDVYARVGPLFVRGEGVELIADNGTRYLDFVAGIGVNALGYNHPVIRAAVERALGSGLIHVSNLYRSDAGERLAEELVARSFADRAFFCNSGAEANEAAFKFARKWSGKSEIVAFSGSFHGRLFATLAATDRPDYRKPFEPLVPGIRIIAREDWAAVDHAVSASRTAAVIVEPVQGEGGVRPVDAEWLGFVRELCDSRGVAVIFDEVQCGLGRTGSLFAYEQAGVVPDILTLAKPLAGGLPMGAVLVTSDVGAALKPGDHATTFGGGPLVASVALEVVRTIADPAFLADVRRKAEWLGARLARLAAGAPRVAEVRGRGLMWGLELAEPAAPIVAGARERGLLVVTAGPQVVRLLPPLVITLEELERGVAILEELLA